MLFGSKPLLKSLLNLLKGSVSGSLGSDGVVTSSSLSSFLLSTLSLADSSLFFVRLSSELLSPELPACSLWSLFLFSDELPLVSPV
ncbi:hypothetical protein ACA758_04790 [Mycoplasmopsis agassizii]|uniref:hypothetical protein n=1 Tax=Mycoplasmopsis agassizii TaxID=33922 RepID=UPI003526D72E